MQRNGHHQKVPSRLRVFARAMRREPTDAESAKWRLLRDRRFAGYKFRRQVPFQNYILDFVCYERRVVVEIGGSQHADSVRDQTRDAVLEREGFRVVRSWNHDVLKRRQSVAEDLWHRLAETDLSPGSAFQAEPPSPRGEG